MTDQPYYLSPSPRSWITTRRLQKGLTYKRLSELTGISIAYLCQLALGDKTRPSPEIRKRLERALA